MADWLCFAVYSANLAFARAYRPVLEPLGLTYTQYIALAVLGEEGDQTVGGLGARLFLESNTLTPVLKSLEIRGYVRRRRDPADERRVMVGVTEAGRLLGGGPAAQVRAACALGPDELARLRDGIARLRDSILTNSG